MEEKNSYLSADPETIRQIDEKMPPEEELQDLAEFFKVFGGRKRYRREEVEAIRTGRKGGRHDR